MSISVIKIGGNVIDDDQLLTEFLNSLRGLSGHKILVHGGGKIATRMADSLEIKTKMIDGRRVTDDQTIDIVTMTYAGLINKKIVSKLQSFGMSAIGLTGADGNLIQSKKRDLVNGLDYGWVGDPETVNTELLKTLVENEHLPVITPITHDGQGNLLNTNADTIASCLAAALAKYYEVELNYCFEKNGVLGSVDDSNSLIKELDIVTYQKLKEDKKINEGMIPKLDNAFDAIERGVKQVRILNHADLFKIENKEYDDFTSIH